MMSTIFLGFPTRRLSDAIAPFVVKLATGLKSDGHAQPLAIGRMIPVLSEVAMRSGKTSRKVWFTSSLVLCRLLLGRHCFLASGFSVEP